MTHETITDATPTDPDAATGITRETRQSVESTTEQVDVLRMLCWSFILMICGYTALGIYAMVSNPQQTAWAIVSTAQTTLDRLMGINLGALAGVAQGRR
jgi:hypothetical protein